MAVVGRKLTKYLDSSGSVVVIPFDMLGSDMVKNIISLITYGWALSAYRDEGVCYYQVFDIEKNTKGCRDINVCKGKLMGFFNRVKQGYGTSVTVGHYLGNERLQRFMDWVLVESSEDENIVDGCMICVAVDGDDIKFVEVVL